MGTQKFTLVCGGGGVWGVAWMTGLVAGLSDAGIALRAAEAFIGTSAGSVVASLLAGSLTTEALYERQADPAKQPHEQAPAPENLQALMALMTRPWPDDAAKRHAMCELAKTARTIPLAERRAGIIGRLGPQKQSWPEKSLSITAVDMQTQELTVFTAASGVSLADAVCASCAVPGVWPPAALNGRRYVDGGIWKTAENAHLAQGAGSIVILAPLALAGLGESAGLIADIAALEAQGSNVLLISADAASLHAMGGNPLDPATRKPGAEAGRAQGAREAARLRQLAP